ncbi:siderophore-iron reductase FhuF [Neobacillus bataviensis]|uniref:siderophore-iron reductase FhuF n=1 Tax=Neobacillus bataviensis TaxID=220685 RepID=UPI001CBB8DAB|nr:siderophore-iron reductase FhuF [Neobacillus bataviensis]
MAKLLTETGLQKYRLAANLKNSFHVADLLNDKFLKLFIANLADSIGAPNEKAAASIFIKRYAFVAVISLYAMSVWNKKINVSISNIEMESPEKGKDWLPSFLLKDEKEEDWNGKARADWRKDMINELFAKNIFPIIDKLEKTFGISKLILWENIAVYIFWLYESELKDSENSSVQSDFRYLLFEAEGSLFGRYKGNPLQKYYTEKIEDVRMRKTCCFSYQLSAGKRCKTCPCTYITKDGRCQDGESICSTIRSLA